MPVFLDKQILVFLGCDYLRKMVGAKVVLVVIFEVVGRGWGGGKLGDGVNRFFSVFGT